MDLSLILVALLVLISILYMGFYNRVAWMRNKWFQRLLILSWLLIIAYIFLYQIVYVNLEERAPTCLQIYNNPKYTVQMGSFPTTYFNKYYQKNMDLTVADYYWMASRKSYLACGETYDVVSMDALRQNIKAGARCLNLDIFPSDDSLISTDVMPFVRTENMLPGNIGGNSQGLALNDCLNTINQMAWKVRSNYPLILWLNIGGNRSGVYNKTYLKKISDGLLGVFSGRLLDGKYGFAGRDGNFMFGRIPMGDMMGRVGIVTTSYPTGLGELDELVNGGVNQGLQMIEYGDANINYGGLASTHSDKQALVRFNYENVTMVVPPSQFNVFNVVDPKEDLINIDFKDAWAFGCQLVWMNFQLGDDKIMDYLEAFKNASLLVKPDDLRYIPQPNPPVFKQNPDNYYAPRTIQKTGWFSQNV